MQSTSDASGGAGGPTGPSHARVSLRDLCCLFCCPPFPSSIVSKLAFMPPEPSYRMISNETGSQYTLQFVEGRADWPHGESELQNVEVFYTRSRRRNRIACMYVRPCGRDAHFTLLFSHGNAVDLGQMSSFYYGLGFRLGCNVFSYDYSGYGCSSGKPSEKNLYSDISAALLSLRTRYEVPPERVILYGQSIGTVPSVDLASREKSIAAVVLHSPLMSGMRVAFPATQRTWCCDAFPSMGQEWACHVQKEGSLVRSMLLVTATGEPSGVLLLVILLNFAVVRIDTSLEAIDVGRDSVSDLVVVLLLTGSHLWPFFSTRPPVRLVLLLAAPTHGWKEKVGNSLFTTLRSESDERQTFLVERVYREE
uniref:Serine aminopeptidase S33 domain-containing protein n=1 Tax=Plectus sambesii TaxID=2011161 RepID=A0A914WD88_9BILA